MPPTPGIKPRLISGWPNLDPLDAMIISHNKASSIPPPKAYPSTAASIGILISLTLSKKLKRPFDFADFESRVLSSLISAPGEKSFSLPNIKTDLIDKFFSSSFKPS